MFYPDYGLPQFLDRKKGCFKLPKYAKVKLLIKFIKNSTLMRWFKFWKFKVNFTVGKEVVSVLYLILPFWHPSPLEILLFPKENLSFIATFTLVKEAAAILLMLFKDPHFWKGIVIKEGKRYNWNKLSVSSNLANS